MVKAILFDFWGTLVENGTASPTREICRILRVSMPFKDFIVPFEEVFFAKRWETQEEGFRAVFERFGQRPHPVAVEKCVGLWNKNKLLATPYEDTESMLKTLREKGIKLALISNTDNFSVNFVLDKYKLRDYFDAIVLSCDEGKLKTDPALFEVALEKLGVDKEDALMVGDSLETDIEGAKKAGVPSLLIDRKNKREYSPKILTLNELLDQL